MKGNVLGKNIWGMQKIENIKINGMEITFEVGRIKMEEKIVELPSYLPVNGSQLNLMTESGKKVCLKPETKKEINNLVIEFGLDSKRQEELKN